MEIVKQVARLFGWKNAQYESLHEWNRGPWKIRVWRTESDLEGAYTTSASELWRVISTFSEDDGPRRLHKALMSLPRVACVAIVDANGNGVSAYPDWH